MTSTATPLRGRGAVDPAGFRMLRDVSSPYRDGGEEAVLGLIQQAGDLRSGSTEMATAARGWAQRYHLDPARANIVRCLRLPPTGRVLEIGAGCGAVTRYLGERCALVDAVEPVPARAAAAAARTRELAGVRVFVGELSDVPDEPSYDVAVVIGVLEYVGGDSSDPRVYSDFLAGIRSRLAPGGTLVLAIENRLGVKYLAGAPEDHSNRVFDSVEGYPRGGNARTFSRRELEALVAGAGLEPVTRVAFPDYKLTRAVFGEVPEEARSLLYRVPGFPSPDWRGQRPRLADEHSLWRELVHAGLELDFGNSFLVLAGTGTESALWPAGQAGAFFTTDRLPHLNTQTVIEARGDGVAFRRRAEHGFEAPEAGGVRVLDSEVPFQPGTDLITVLADGGLAALAELAGQWQARVEAALAEHPDQAIDVVPHNMIVDPEGRVHVIDVELAGAPASRDRLLRRGAFWLADRATRLAVPGRFQPARTVADVMRQVGSLVGLPTDGSWIEDTIGEEAGFLTTVRPGPPPGLDPEGWRSRIESGLRDRARRELDALPLGERTYHRLRRARNERDEERKRAADLDRELAACRKRLAAAEAARRKLEGSRAVRLARAGQRRAARCAPRGSRRRALVEKLRPGGKGSGS